MMMYIANAVLWLLMGVTFAVWGQNTYTRIAGIVFLAFAAGNFAKYLVG